MKRCQRLSWKGRHRVPQHPQLDPVGVVTVNPERESEFTPHKSAASNVWRYDH